jgi:hypothetical protein
MIAEKLSSEGSLADRSRLYAAAYNALSRNGSVENAMPQFMNTFASSGMLIALLNLKADAIHAAAVDYLMLVWREMPHRLVIAVPGEPGGAGQSVGENHGFFARAENLEGDGADDPLESRFGNGPSPSNPDGLSSSPKSFLTIVRNAQAMSGPSVFDRVKMRNGTRWADIKCSALPLLIKENDSKVASSILRVREGAYEGAVLKQLKRVVPSYPDARVGDCISPKKFQRMAQKAERIANDA